MPFTDADCQRAREDFPALRRTLDETGEPLAFLDGPAGTHVPEAVIEAISHYYRTSNANTHGHFVTSRESEATVLGARRAMAAFLGAPTAEGGEEDWRTVSFGQSMPPPSPSPWPGPSAASGGRGTRWWSPPWSTRRTAPPG